MSRTLSSVALEAIFSQETDEAFVPLVLINHPSMSEPLRVAGSREAVTTNDSLGNNVRYEAYPFSIMLPNDHDDRPPEVSISIDNVDRRIVDSIRTAIDGAPSVTMSIVLESSPTTLEAGPFEFTVRSVEWNRLTVKGVISYEAILDEPYPAGTFNPVEFPGLFQ